MTPLADERRSSFRLHLDPTINAGHMLTTLTIIVGVIVWGVRLESRVDLEATLRARMEQQWERDQARDAASFEEIKAALRRIEEKLDAKQDRRH